MKPPLFYFSQNRQSSLTFFCFLFFMIYKIFEMSNHAFDKVIQGSVMLLKTYSMKVPIEGQDKLKNLIQPLKDLKFEELGLDKATNISAGIGIRNVFKKGGLRISLYYLPKGEVMKMHNHPQMLVITYILKGLISAELFSPLEDGITFEREKQNWTAGNVAFIDGMRTNNKNLHELKAIQDTYFIDVIFPDYDDERDCQSYEIDEEISEKICRLREAEDQEIDWYQI